MEIEEFVETTLAELIEELTAQAASRVRDKEEANRLVGNMLRSLLYNTKPISKIWH